MSMQRILVSLFAGLVLSACSNSTSKSPEKPAAPTASPAVAKSPAGVPPSGNPATRTDPQFFLPPDSELTTTASGLKYMVVREGQGTPPKPNGKFTAHYSGWLTDGTPFDSSYSRNEPLDYPVARMIKGWQEALVMMKPGSEYILVVPAAIGYGAGGMPPVIPPNATLVFRMELISGS